MGTVTIEATSMMPGPERVAMIAAADIESGVAGWLLCQAGRQLYAVPIAHVIEIMRVLPVDSIAGAPPYVRGLCVIRGAPVPVVDIGLLISNEASRSGRLVTIRAGERTIALLVEAVLGIRVFAADTFNQLPALLRDVATEMVAAIGTRDAELLFALRAARIVPESVLDDLDRDGAQS
jgi:purine-binding chemotaxis protein CheW